MRRCDNARSKPIKDECIDLGEYIKVNKKTLKVFAVFLKGTDYFYLAKLYENSNHYFLVSELKKETRRKYEALNSFAGSEEGLEKTIDVMYKLSKEESYRGLKRIR